jgi:hypothetical protein
MDGNVKAYYYECHSKDGKACNSGAWMKQISLATTMVLVWAIMKFDS